MAQDLVKKHSEFIAYPISLWVEKTSEKEVEDDEDMEESTADKAEDEEGKIEEVEDKPKEKKTKKVRGCLGPAVAGHLLWMLGGCGGET